MLTSKTITTYTDFLDDEIQVEVHAEIWTSAFVGDDDEVNLDDVTITKVLRTDNKHDILPNLSDTEIESLKQEVYDAYTSF